MERSPDNQEQPPPGAGPAGNGAERQDAVAGIPIGPGNADFAADRAFDRQHEVRAGGDVGLEVELLMALVAGRRDVGVVDRRGRVLDRAQLVGRAMAGGAECGAGLGLSVGYARWWLLSRLGVQPPDLKKSLLPRGRGSHLRCA